MAAKLKEYDGASPAKIFIGGLAKETTMETFEEHFGKYGKIIDAVIMKDRYTGKPRGFGFITYDDPSVVDKVIEDTHVINGKQGVQVRAKYAEMEDLKRRGISPEKDLKVKEDIVAAERELAELPIFEPPSVEMEKLGAQIMELNFELNQMKM